MFYVPLGIIWEILYFRPDYFPQSIDQQNNQVPKLLIVFDSVSFTVKSFLSFDSFQKFWSVGNFPKKDSWATYFECPREYKLVFSRQLIYLPYTPPI